MDKKKNVLNNDDKKDEKVVSKVEQKEEGSSNVFQIPSKDLITNETNNEKVVSAEPVIEVGNTINEIVEEPNSNAETSNPSEAMNKQLSIVLNSKEGIAMAKMRLFATEVVKSSVSPYKREADAMLVLTRGVELGLSYGVAINNIFAINGKTGMSVHLHKALLQKAGVYFEPLEDYVDVYNYGLMKEDKFFPMGTTTKRKVEGYSVSPAVVDKQTTYYFEREVKVGSKTKTKTFEVSYKYSEAVIAGLTTKEVWVKYARSLMKARCFTLGSSEIASDVINGMYGINELAMEFGQKFTINENLEESITIDTSHEEIN